MADIVEHLVCEPQHDTAPPRREFESLTFSQRGAKLMAKLRPRSGAATYIAPCLLRCKTAANGTFIVFLKLNGELLDHFRFFCAGKTQCVHILANVFAEIRHSAVLLPVEVRRQTRSSFGAAAPASFGRPVSTCNPACA